VKPIHNAVYYHPELDELFVGFIRLNDWGALGMGCFFVEGFASGINRLNKKYHNKLILIGDL
jgi:hypothetical protein